MEVGVSVFQDLLNCVNVIAHVLLLLRLSTAVVITLLLECKICPAGGCEEQH